MHQIFRGAVLAIVSAFTFSTFAFQLGDHERVTAQAVAEFKACFPQYHEALNLQELVAADLDEDTNLFDKELFYSHFYNPHKKLRLLWRADSSGRIADLQPALLQCREANGAVTSDEISSLGHAIHHFQDMAVPAHVVPVNHSFWDGFESYVLLGDISSEWNCQQILDGANGDLEDILKETAEQTLNAMDKTTVEAGLIGTKNTIQLGASEFWTEAGDDGFGSYGTVGNHFGETQLEIENDQYQVSENFYRDFKREQMKLAVRATLRGLAWIFR